MGHTTVVAGQVRAIEQILTVLNQSPTSYDLYI